MLLITEAQTAVLPQPRLNLGHRVQLEGDPLLGGKIHVHLAVCLNETSIHMYMCLNRNIHIHIYIYIYICT